MTIGDHKLGPWHDAIGYLPETLARAQNLFESAGSSPPAVFTDPNNPAPEGDFVLVPRVANTDMIGVWRTSQAQGDSLETSYCKLIAAAPNPPIGGEVQIIGKGSERDQK